jgi:hypothetical protein
MRKYILVIVGLISLNSLLFAQGEMVFSSQQPVAAANKKTIFTSGEYIYGSVDLGGKTIKEFFKIPDPKGDDEYAYLYYILEIKIGDEWPKENGWMYTLVKDADKEKTVLNFDVLPEPSKVTTVLSGTKDFTTGLGAAPLYEMIQNQTFPKNGTYNIKVRFYYKSLDAYGNEQPKEKWPECTGSFSFAFNESDVPVLLKNNKEADAIAAENAFKMSRLPAIFSTPSKVNDPKVTPAKLAVILKRDRPERTMLKFVIGEVDGELWKIAKNDLDIPRYRYFTPYIHVAYKMDGKCYVGTVELIEDYLGGGKYGPLKVGSTSAGNRTDNVIDCTKVK